METKRLFVLFGAFALVAAMAAPAVAQYAQASNADCVIPINEDDDEVSTFAAGEIIIILADPPGGTAPQFCFTPNTTATVTLESDPIVLAVVQVDSGGGFETQEITLPRDLENGAHTLRTSGTLNGQPVSYSSTITITGGVAAGRGGLPVTGGQIILLTLWALFLAGFGSVLISATWRRWREAKLHAVLGVSTAQPLDTSVAAAMDGHRPADAFPELRPAATRAMPLVDHPAELVQRKQTSSNGNGHPAPVDEVVERATARTSELVARLQDEIKAWSRPAD